MSELWIVEIPFLTEEAANDTAEKIRSNESGFGFACSVIKHNPDAHPE